MYWSEPAYPASMQLHVYVYRGFSFLVGLFSGIYLCCPSAHACEAKAAGSSSRILGLKMPTNVVDC